MPVRFKADMTLCVWQPVEYWLEAVQKKHGKLLTWQCGRIIGERDHGKMMSELKRGPKSIIGLAKTLLLIKFLGTLLLLIFALCFCSL